MWKLRLRLAIPRKGIHKWDFRCSVCNSQAEKYSSLAKGTFFSFLIKIKRLKINLSSESIPDGRVA
jgi:hypothetical protein